MKILVDENVPRVTVDALRDAGHDVSDMRGTVDKGINDDQVWAKAQAEGRLLVTTDKGFVQMRGSAHHGILIVRLRQPNRAKIDARIRAAVARFPDAEWPGLLVVVRDAVMSVARAQSDEG